MDESWRSHSLCDRMVKSGELTWEQRDTLFFPTRHYKQRDVDAAKAICRQCFVRPECLEYALATREGIGIWGGSTENERRVMRRKRKAAAREMKRLAMESVSA